MLELSQKPNKPNILKAKAGWKLGKIGFFEFSKFFLSFLGFGSFFIGFPKENKGFLSKIIVFLRKTNENQSRALKNIGFP